MSSPYYKRRKRSWVRNLWAYRRLVALAGLLGVILWFILINRDPVTVSFPFRLGQISSTSGLMILLGVAAGSGVTFLAMGIYLTLRPRAAGGETVDHDERIEDRPPSDYAAKTGEGFSDAPWTKR
jgi:uncharacterized integral membrane protein